MLDSPSIPLLNLAAWLSAGGVFLTAWLAGALACFRLSPSDPVDDVLVRLTVGLAVLPAAVLMAGQIEGFLLLRPVWVAPALLGAAHAGYTAIRRRALWSGDAAGQRTDDPPQGGRISAATVLATLPFVGWMVYLLGPLSSPPVNYDVLEYHLGVVPHFFEIGRIDPIPHVFYTAQPIATEMLYTLASVLEGTPRGGAPGYVHWMLIGLAGLLMWRALERSGVSRPVALLVPFGFLTHPILVRLQLDRMTDLTGAVFLLGGWLLWLSRRREDEVQNRWAPFILLGALAGGAVGSKWTNAGTAAWAIAMAPAAGLWIGRDASARTTSTHWFKAAGLFVLGGALVLTPWIAWVGAETGNPLAPFGAGWFPTERWGPAHQQYLMETHRPLAMFSGDYWTRLLGRVLSPAIGSWPLFLAFALWLGAWMISRRSGRRATPEESPGVASRNVLVSGVLAVVVGLLLWGRLRHAADRFLAPVVAMEFLMLGAAVTLLLRNAAPRWRSFAGVFAFVLFLVAALTSPMPPLAGASIYWDRASGRMSSTDFLRSGLGATTDFFKAANALPEGSRLMAIGEARRFYFRHPVTLASVFDRHPVAAYVERAKSPAGLRASLREAGYTHLAVNEYETARLLDFHPPPALENDPEFMELRERKNYATLVEKYAGASEFGAHPLREEDRELYTRFLRRMREEAVYRNAGPAGRPAFWISPL